MNKRVKQLFIILCAFALVTQASLAQSADYFLERVAIHARLMQAKAPSPPAPDLSGADENPEMAFTDALGALINDLEGWKEKFPADQRLVYQEVRSGLEDHIEALAASSQSLELSVEQATHYSLLLLELEQASKNIDSEYLHLATRTEDRRRRRNNVRFNIGVAPGWNAWGGPWGGWGAWGAGPYFGQPFGPGFGPRCW